MIRFWSLIYDLVSPFAPVSVKGWFAMLTILTLLLLRAPVPKERITITITPIEPRYALPVDRPFGYHPLVTI